MRIDIHTHTLVEDTSDIQVLSCDPTDSSEGSCKQKTGNNRFLSFGVHPWNAMRWNPGCLLQIKSEITAGRVLMLGEIGLDGRCGVPLEVQRTAFKSQLELASSYALPVVLHCVGATSEMIQMKRAFPAIPSWIIHGFRGKPQVVLEFLKAGFYLSFGAKFNADALRICPMNRLFVETDNSDCSIFDVYNRVAKALSCTEQTLEAEIHQNFLNVFFDDKMSL